MPTARASTPPSAVTATPTQNSGHDGPSTRPNPPMMKPTSITFTVIHELGRPTCGPSAMTPPLPLSICRRDLLRVVPSVKPISTNPLPSFYCAESAERGSVHPRTHLRLTSYGWCVCRHDSRLPTICEELPRVPVVIDKIL